MVCGSGVWWLLVVGCWLLVVGCWLLWGVGGWVGGRRGGGEEGPRGLFRCFFWEEGAGGGGRVFVWRMRGRGREFFLGGGVVRREGVGREGRRESRGFFLVREGGREGFFLFFLSFWEEGGLWWCFFLGGEGEEGESVCWVI